MLIIDNYQISTSILDILERLKLILVNGKLKDVHPKQKDILVTCPFHNGGHEKKPACNIYIGGDADNSVGDKLPYGFFRCFVCGEKGDFIKFVAGCFNSSLDYAKDWLIDNFSHSDYSPAIKLREEIQIKKPVSYLNKDILNSPNFQSYCPYLAERGVSPEIAQLFDVKYDRQFKQIVFPCYDIKGNLIMLATREIKRKIFYLDKNREKPVYGLDKIIKMGKRKAIISEGPFDALHAWTLGYPTIATFGKMSEKQIRTINNSGIQVLYLGFDSDSAGRAFTEELKSKLSKRILAIDLKIPSGKKDLGELNQEEFDKMFLQSTSN